MRWCAKNDKYQVWFQPSKEGIWPVLTMLRALWNWFYINLIPYQPCLPTYWLTDRLTHGLYKLCQHPHLTSANIHYITSADHTKPDQQPNFTMLTKFHNFNQISQLRSNFTFAIKFHNFDPILQLRPNFRIMTKFHNCNIIS